MLPGSAHGRAVGSARSPSRVLIGPVVEASFRLLERLDLAGPSRSRVDLCNEHAY
jgi:hypothetical protein